ncbi:single-stranded DNA-binding protein [Rheinheimera tilapiae]|uniref:Single-stranded DNA-binding protein n=1 Tax=Rheinheimera tilapiae TaxID=875043 RepID=A0ABV6BA60_9GAMM
MAINLFVAGGNIGRDCEVRVTPAGKHIATFPLPVKQGYGEHEKTSWVQCKLFGGQAEKLPNYLLKGVKVVVQGEFVLDEWNDKDGQKRQTPTVIVNSLEFMSQNQSNAGQTNQPSQRAPASQQGGYNQRPAAPAQNQMSGAPMAPPIDFDDDPDIPF